MKRLSLFISIVLCLITASWAAMVEGVMDVCPMYYMSDAKTPIAIHFSSWSTAWSTFTDMTAKIRIQQPGTSSFGNASTWTSTFPARWEADGAIARRFQSFPISNSTVVSGWLYAVSFSGSNFGITTVSVRYYRQGGLAVVFDLATLSGASAFQVITALDSSSNGGWIEGTLTATSTLVLVKDAANNILGTGISEDNGITEGNSPSSGYFKIALPVGSQNLHLSFLNQDNTGYASDYPLGIVNITAGNTTLVGPVPVQLSDFNTE